MCPACKSMRLQYHEDLLCTEEWWQCGWCGEKYSDSDLKRLERKTS